MSVSELVKPDQQINVKSLVIPEFKKDISFDILSEITEEDKAGIVENLRSPKIIQEFRFPANLAFLSIFNPNAIIEFENDSSLRKRSLDYIKSTAGLTLGDFPSTNLRHLEEIKMSVPSWLKHINLKDYKGGFGYVEDHINDTFSGVPEFITRWVNYARSYKILYPEKFSDEWLNKFWETINLNERLSVITKYKDFSERYVYIANHVANFVVLFGQRPEITNFINDNFDWDNVRRNIESFRNNEDYANLSSFLVDLAIITAKKVIVDSKGLKLEFEKQEKLITPTPPMPIVRRFS